MDTTPRLMDDGIRYQMVHHPAMDLEWRNNQRWRLGFVIAAKHSQSCWRCPAERPRKALNQQFDVQRVE